jgi:ParB family chromosome partitioning protein
MRARAGAAKLEALAAGLKPSAARVLEQVGPEMIDPNPQQPRQEFAPEALDELVRSISRHGLLQPLTVRRGKSPGRFEIVAGERRLRAALRLGLPVVPCVVLELADDRMLEFALVENLQRQDLDPIEAAAAYRTLMQVCGCTQDELADTLCLGRSTIANAVRLLELPKSLQENVSRGTISAGHARAIAALPGEAARKALAARVARDSPTVREPELEVKRLRGKKPERSGPEAQRPAYLAEIEERLRHRLGTKVAIQESGPSRGRIVIDFYGEEDFERLLALFE